MSNKDSMVYPDGQPVGRYSAIGNDVLDKLADIELTRAERRVLDRVIKDTIGYSETQGWSKQNVRRLTHEIPKERFVDKTGLAESEINSALDNLEKRNIIKREGDDITFNHHLEQWS